MDEAHKQDPGHSQDRRPEPVVHSITGAPAPHSDDLDARIRRYLFSMAIRTVCVVLVIVIDGPLRWVFAVFAIILPGLAVVMANVAGKKVRRVVPGVTPPTVTQVSLPPVNPVVRSTATSTATSGGHDGKSSEQPNSTSGEWTA